MNNTSKSMINLVAVVIFLIYILGVLYFTLLWKTGNFTGEYNLHLNLIPFYWLLEPIWTGKDYYVSQVILNILLFVPLGFLLPVFNKPYSARILLLYATSTTLCIEFIQPLFNRCTDIDDIMMNVMGAILGFFLYKMVLKFVLLLTRQHWRVKGQVLRSISQSKYLLGQSGLTEESPWRL